MNRQDRIRGCMIGGAAGDALGYAVEFLPESVIFKKYGMGGIERYAKDPVSGLALISDDTQMSLFTADGLLTCEYRRLSCGAAGLPRMDVLNAYADWLMTQTVSCTPLYAEPAGRRKRRSWLMGIPDLYSRRAPGNTCLSALEHRDDYPVPDADYVRAGINSSKGCGGVMRTAPVALLYGDNVPVLSDPEAAQIAALTHGHPLGFLPSALLNRILSLIVFGDGNQDLRTVVHEALDSVCREFEGTEHLAALREIIEKAVLLSENDSNDLDNIHLLGEGWVAEETLAIAVFCSLRHEYEFAEGIIAAVNHNGDSDSTGAVTGNILGAINGYSGIEDMWKQDLELKDVILELADDLYRIRTGSTSASDPDLARKYGHAL